MPKWLKWPSDKQTVFLLVCGLVTAAVAIDQEANHIQLLAIFFIVLFIGLFMVGWYDKLWLVSLAGIFLFHLAVMLNEIMMPSGSFLWETLVLFSPTWAFLTFFLWIVPRQIKENTRNMVEEGRIHEIPSPGYKLSEFFKIVWVFSWVILLLINTSWLFLLLGFVDWEKVYVSIFTFQTNGFSFALRESRLAIDSFTKLIWVGLAVISFVDSNRKDANVFNFGVGIFTAWQVIKIWLFYAYSYPNPEAMIWISFAQLLIGGSLLLRAAWNRPSPEAEIALE